MKSLARKNMKWIPPILPMVKLNFDRVTKNGFVGGGVVRVSTCNMGNFSNNVVESMVLC